MIINAALKKTAFRMQDNESFERRTELHYLCVHTNICYIVYLLCTMESEKDVYSC